MYGLSGGLGKRPLLGMDYPTMLERSVDSDNIVVGRRLETSDRGKYHTSACSDDQ